MKIFISAIVALGLIIAATFGYSYYLEKTVGEITTFTEKIEKAVQDFDWNECKKDTDGLLIMWDKKKKMLETFINHNEVDTINQLIHEINGYVDFENQQEVTVRLRTLKIQLVHIKENENVSIENILSTGATLST